MSRELRQDQLAAAFCDHFAHLAAVVADASRYGQSPGLEHRFVAERAWLIRNYPHVKRQLARHLEPTRPTAQSWTAPPDSFERLFSSPSLLHILCQDPATLNQLLNATGEAVEKAFRTAGKSSGKATVS